MAQGHPCPKCQAKNPVGTQYCSDCGGPLQAKVACSGCGALISATTRFCTGCGAKVGAGSSGSGSVQDGKWLRAPGEFVRRIQPEDMDTSLGSKVIHVPNGSMGAILSEGKLVEVLPPGKQTTMGWWKRVKALFTGPKSAFYLIDRRPLPIPLRLSTTGVDPGTTVNLQLLLDVRLNKDPASLERFLDCTVGPKDSYSARALYQLIKPHFVRVAKVAAQRHSEGFDAVGREVQEQLSELAEEHGVALRVSVGVVDCVHSLDLRLGGAPAPAPGACVGCKAEVAASMKFCTACGVKQPTQQTPGDGAGLFTADGEQVELDLVLSYRSKGPAPAAVADSIKASLGAAARKQLRGLSYEDVCQGSGFQSLESGFTKHARETFVTLGLEVAEVTVLDVKSQKEEWLLGARADIKRAQEQVTVGREWLKVEEGELDLKALAHTMALRQKVLDRDFEFARREAELADEERSQKLDLGHEFATRAADQAHERALHAADKNHEFGKDQVTSADRERRQDLLEAQARLDQKDAARLAERDVALDKAQREVARHGAAEDHADAVAGERRRHEAGALAAEHRREAEASEADHRMASEARAAEHAASLARHGMTLDSEQKRLQADDQVYADRSRQDLALDAAKRREDLAQASADRTLDRELSAEERRAKLQAEKLAALAQSEQELAAQDHAHEQAMAERMQGMDAAQMIAVRAAELAKAKGGGEFAAALAAMASGKDAEERQRLQEDLYKQMLAQQQQHTASLSASQAQKDQVLLQMMEQMLQANQASVQAMAGSQVASQAAAHDALRGAAEQARSMSERAMGAMSSVAASASERPAVNALVTPAPTAVTQTVVAPASAETPPCKDCGKALASASAAWCGDCGAKQA